MSFTVYLPDKRTVDLGPSFDVIARLAELGRIDPSDRYGALMGLMDANGEELNGDYAKQVATEAGQFQAEYNQRLSPPLRVFLGELSLLSVGDAKSTYVHPYTREGHPVGGYWRDNGNGVDIPRPEFAKLLDDLPVGTRFTLSPATPDAGYWPVRGTWEKLDMSGLPYWYNAERGLHRTSADFHATAAGPVLDALKIRPGPVGPGKRHAPSTFIAPPETAVARGTIRHVNEAQPSPLLQREIDRGFKAIDGVHSIKIDGEPPPKVPILSFEEPGMMWGGAIQLRTDGGLHFPEYIRIPEGSEIPPETAIIHEFGHYLDSQIFGKRENFGSRQAVGADGYGDAKYDHSLRTVMDTIANSGAVSRLLKMMRGDERFAVREGDNEPRMISTADPEIREFTEYLLQPEELFARAYTQYVSAKSRDERLNARIYYYSQANGQLHPQQWETYDFAPIQAAFDKLFTELGWNQEKMAA